MWKCDEMVKLIEVRLSVTGKALVVKSVTLWSSVAGNVSDW